MNKALRIGIAGLGACLLYPAAALADTATTRGGVTIKSDDGKFEADIGGRVMLDGYVFDDDTSGAMTSEHTNGFFFRRMRVESAGKLYDWKYKVEVDFADEGVAFKDVYIGTGLGPVDLKVGQFKAPFSLDELTSSRYITFLERAYIANAPLTPAHQIGVAVGGKGEFYTWEAAGYSLDTADSGTSEGHGVGARGTYAPVMEASTVIHLGVAAGIDRTGLDAAGAGTGTGAGPRTRQRLRVALRSDAARPTLIEFPTVGGAEPGVELMKYGLEGAGVFGPFWISGEYAIGSFSSTAAGQADQDLQTYYLQGGVFVTGESRPYKGGRFDRVKPKSPIGAFEVAGRYDFAKNKDSATAADGDCAGEPTCEVSSFTLGVNWYFHPNARWMLDYTSGEFDTGGADTLDLSAIATRLQIDW